MGRLDKDGNHTFISRYDNVYKCMGFNVAGDVVLWDEVSVLFRNADD